MQQERIIVLDFGGQYKQLIARRVRECNVYCEIHPHTLSIEKIREMNPKGIIMTGGPASVYDEKSPTCSPELFEMGNAADLEEKIRLILDREYDIDVAPIREHFSKNHYLEQ